MKFTEEQIDRLVSGKWITMSKPENILNRSIGDLIDLYNKKKEAEKTINIKIEIGKCYVIQYDSRNIKIVKLSEMVLLNTYKGSSISLYEGRNIKMETNSCIILTKGIKCLIFQRIYLSV